MRFILLSFILLCTFSSASVAQTIYYVDGTRPDDAGAGTSWATAKKFVQSAINLAGAGSEVWVAKGTYKPTTGLDRNATFTLKAGVKLYGGFIGTETSLAGRNEIQNLSILSGDLLGNDAGGAALTNNGENSFRVVTAFVNPAYIDGFTITGGTGSEGAGLCNNSGNVTIVGCIFLNNTTSAGVYGSALFFRGGFNTIRNCVFSNNLNNDGGSVLATRYNANIIFTNSVFSRNNGTMFYETLNSLPIVSLTNCTIFDNGGPGDADAKLLWSDYELRGCVYNSQKHSAFSPMLPDNQQFSFSCRYSYTQHGGKGNRYSSDFYQDLSNPIGPDGLWRTADDGYRLISCTRGNDLGDPCDPNRPTIDITGNLRTGSLPDAGAYEIANRPDPENAIPSVTTISYGTQYAGLLHYSTCTAEIMAINGTSPSTVTGAVSVKVWVDTIQNPDYVKRHYQAVPETNPTTATGVITLYFTQQEFTDFNAVNAVKLPIDAADAANNKANLRIERRSGSSNAHGTTNSYATTPAPVTIIPTSVTWNAAAARWEVIFTTNGFGGYFAKTLATVLPLRLITFNGNRHGVNNKLQWTTENEINTKSFDVERSADGNIFSKIGSLNSRNTLTENRYDFTDTHVTMPVNYYRLKLTDVDGKYTHSNIIKLSGNNTVRVYPNPPGANKIVNITTPESFRNTQLTLYNAQGQRLLSKTIMSNNTQLDISRYPKGSYTLKFADGTVTSVIRN